MPETERFEGHPNRECGDHYALGERAWCFSCSTSCYPDAPCPGCEVPMLRTRLDALLANLRAEVEHLRQEAQPGSAEALQTIIDRHTGEGGA